MAEALVRDPLPRRLVRFYKDVTAEVKRVTWPDKGQVKQLSIGVLMLSLFIGGVIALLDFVLQQLLVVAIPAILGR